MTSTLMNIELQPLVHIESANTTCLEKILVSSLYHWNYQLLRYAALVSYAGPVNALASHNLWAGL